MKIKTLFIVLFFISKINSQDNFQEVIEDYSYVFELGDEVVESVKKVRPLSSNETIRINNYNGQISFNLVNGEIHGFLNTKSPGDTLSVNYQNGILDGKFFFKSLDEEIIIEGFFSKGIKDSIFRYTLNDICLIVMFKEDIVDGPFVFYNDDGSKVIGMIEEGEEKSNLFYDKDGELISMYGNMNRYRNQLNKFNESLSDFRKIFGLNSILENQN